MRQSGNIQPCVPEIEDALIGAILLEPFVLPKVVAMLKPECFYKSDNRLIFTACIALWQSNQVIDILTTTQKLKALNQLESVGGAYGVSSKTNRVASAANAEIHAALIYEKYVLRELMRISNKTQMLCEEPKADALEILETVFKDFAKVDFIGKSNVQQVGDVAIS
jgi:replicative DNA helicase